MAEVGCMAHARRKFYELQQARPIAQALHAWMAAHRRKIPDDTGIAGRWITA